MNQERVIHNHDSKSNLITLDFVDPVLVSTNQTSNPQLSDQPVNPNASSENHARSYDKMNPDTKHTTATAEDPLFSYAIQEHVQNQQQMANDLFSPSPGGTGSKELQQRESVVNDFDYYDEEDDEE